MGKQSNSSEDDLKIFMSCCSEFFANNSIEVFQRFFCPISIVEADVKEYVIDEYDSVELLVLRLYDSGITEAEMISAMTGIDVGMVKKLLFTETYTYGHIDPTTGEITAAGRKTLDENMDTDNLFQHALYNVKREIQADAVTGTIIRAEMEMMKGKMSYYSDSIKPYIAPLEAVKIDEELEREIRERLQYYIDQGYISDGNTIKDLRNLCTRELRYRTGYFVQMKNFQYPFIALPFDMIQDKNKKKCVVPIAIAEADAKKIDFQKRKHEYLVRKNKCFSHLVESKEKFKKCPEIDEETMQSLLAIGNEDEEDIDFTENDLDM